MQGHLVHGILISSNAFPCLQHKIFIVKAFHIIHSQTLDMDCSQEQLGLFMALEE